MKIKIRKTASIVNMEHGTEKGLPNKLKNSYRKSHLVLTL